MHSRNHTRLCAGVQIMCLGLAAGLCAQTSGDSSRRVEQSRTDLRCPDSMEVVVSTAEFKPGESLNLHIHHGVEAVYVIQGATVLSAGRDTIRMPTGQSIVNLRDVKHAGFKVIGTTSLKLYTVHVVDKGKPLYDTPR